MSLRRSLWSGVGVLVACIALLVSLGGCASNNYAPSLAEPSLKTPTIGEADTLRVGVNTSNQPLAGMGSDKIIGIDVDIAAALADNLGLKLSVVDVGTDPESALKNDKVDIVMGIDSDQTYEGVWLSKSYLPTGIALFSMTENAALPIAGSESTFAAQNSSRSALAVINEFGEDKLTQTQTLGDAFADLEAGKVDFVAADAIIGDYSAHTENIDAHIIGLLKAPTGYEIGVNQANGILRDTIEEEIQSLTDDGIIDIIEKKWLNNVITLDDLPQTPGTPIKTEEPQQEGQEGQDVSDAGEGAVDESTAAGTGAANATTGTGAAAGTAAAGATGAGTNATGTASAGTGA